MKAFSVVNIPSHRKMVVKDTNLTKSYLFDRVLDVYRAVVEPLIEQVNNDLILN